MRFRGSSTPFFFSFLGNLLKKKKINTYGFSIALFLLFYISPTFCCLLDLLFYFVHDVLYPYHNAPAVMIFHNETLRKAQQAIDDESEDELPNLTGDLRFVIHRGNNRGPLRPLKANTKLDIT